MPDVNIAATTTGTTHTAAQEINGFLDNRRYKNLLVAKGRRASHSYPMNFTKAASDMTHAKLVFRLY